MSSAPALVVMGVSGSGKSTVGAALAKRLGVAFRDADEFHPPANIEKMSAGIPLVDEDRWPWLDAIAAAIRDTPEGTGLVISCSALKRVYRDRIVAGAVRPVRFVYLDGTYEMIAARMAERQHHFMPLSLLESQLATLEPPAPEEGAIDVSIAPPADEIVAEIVARLESDAPRAPAG